MKYSIILINTLIFLLISLVSQAGPIVIKKHIEIGANGVGCDKSAMTIQSMTNLAGGANPTPLPVNATDCYAVKAPDNDFASTYTPNTGKLNEGMFNGEVNNKGYYVDPNLFLDNANDRWVDENTPGGLV